MHRSFVTKEWIDSYLANKNLFLPEDAVKRFFSVVRIKPDEEVGVFDGCGREVVGVLGYQKQNKQAHFLHARLFTENKTSPSITLIQAALEESKLDETFKRGTEIGIDEFVIFNAERSEPFCYEKALKKEKRFTRIAQDASRQSGRLFVPQIIFCDSLSMAVKQSSDALMLVGAVSGAERLSLLLSKCEGQSQIAIVVGPEGGLSTSEMELLKSSGGRSVRWAPFTLRSELAGVFAMAIVHSVLGRA